VCDQEATKILVNEEKAKAHYGALAPRGKKLIKSKYHLVFSPLLNRGKEDIVDGQ